MLLTGKVVNISNYDPNSDENCNCHSWYCYYFNDPYYDVKRGTEIKVA